MLKFWGSRNGTDCDGTTRRDFLSLMGFGAAAATIIRSALASVIGAAVLNGIACRLNWSRIRS